MVPSTSFKKVFNGSDRKKVSNEEMILNTSGFRTERGAPSDSTVTILLFDLDKTVTEFKFDSACGTTDQLVSFLTAQLQ